MLSGMREMRSLHYSRAGMLVREMLFTTLLLDCIPCITRVLVCLYSSTLSMQKQNRHGFSTGGVRNKRDASLGLLAC